MQLRNLLRATAVPAALVASLLAGTTTLAATPTTSFAVTTSTTIVVGTGRLAATGTGTAIVRGTFVESGWLRGGSIRIDGINRFTAIRVNGWRSKIRIDSDSVLFRGVVGTFTIAGAGIRVTVVSPLAHVVAFGRGAAFLRGTGTYSVNGRGPFHWSSTGAWIGL